MSNKFNIQKLVYTGLLAALAGVLMSLEFSIPFFPPFYKIDFSDMPSVIALFTLGPLPALFVEISKLLIKLFTVGTNSMYVGEVSNLLGALVFIIPMWLMYKKSDKSVKSIVILLFVNVIIRTAWMCFCNAFITLPMYAAAMGLSVDDVVVMVSSVNPFIKNLPTFIILATIPFNLIKLGLVYTLSYVLYNRLKVAVPGFRTMNNTARA
ncbi:Gx transporter family protein [Oribacterium sp. WCC10]|uniref:ECF transporter S component n=1 Tax=Oribacterium sp. WCC10 TaxID=1855343 RepID=UPI0008EA378C|nr:Gx transporter family protein [Oribacterium sp. WCC10]SFG51577.1 Riboflavin transporter FmnP [Oribacterium sp. WCC10]